VRRDGLEGHQLLRLGKIDHVHHRPVVVVVAGAGAGAAEGRVDDELVVVVAGQAGALADALQLGAVHLVEAHHDMQLVHRPATEFLDEGVLRASHRPPWAGVGVGVCGSRRLRGGESADDGDDGSGDSDEEAAGVHGRHGFY